MAGSGQHDDDFDLILAWRIGKGTKERIQRYSIIKYDNNVFATGQTSGVKKAK